MPKIEEHTPKIKLKKESGIERVNWARERESERVNEFERVKWGDIVCSGEKQSPIFVWGEIWPPNFLSLSSQLHFLV